MLPPPFAPARLFCVCLLAAPAKAGMFGKSKKKRQEEEAARLQAEEEQRQREQKAAEAAARKRAEEEVRRREIEEKKPEIIAACRSEVGKDFPIILRWSQWKQQDYTARLAPTEASLADFLEPLVDAGVDIFHCSQRRFWEPEFYTFKGFFVRIFFVSIIIIKFNFIFI